MYWLYCKVHFGQDYHFVLTLYFCPSIMINQILQYLLSRFFFQSYVEKVLACWVSLSSEMEVMWWVLHVERLHGERVQPAIYHSQVRTQLNITTDEKREVHTSRSTEGQVHQWISSFVTLPTGNPVVHSGTGCQLNQNRILEFNNRIWTPSPQIHFCDPKIPWKKNKNGKKSNHPPKKCKCISVAVAGGEI